MEEINRNPHQLDMIYQWPPSSKYEEPKSSSITLRDQEEGLPKDNIFQSQSSIVEDIGKSTTTVPTPIVTDDSTSVSSSYVYPRTTMTTTTTTPSARKPDIRSHLRFTSTGGGLYGDLFTLKNIVKLRPIYPSLSTAAKVVTSKDWTVSVYYMELLYYEAGRV